ncbi:MAG: hypothetical protein J0H01_12325 [Rhizobiales bacterium]|nr:hypothetical protein [Hyphomicrobiales bacterium]
MLVPIDETNLESVHALLARGFPSQQPSFWLEGLRRQADHHARIQGGPVGQILRVRDQDVGIILTMRSRRIEPDGTTRDVVNLSSWYIDEAHRWLAPRMLKAVMSEAGTVYTDLTPSPSVVHLNGRLGLTVWTDGVLLAALPLAALHYGSAAAQVVPLDQLARDALPEAARTVLEDHARFGCICVALSRGDRLWPVVFARTRHKGLPGARVVYAPSKIELKASIGAVARFLLGQGVISLEIPARRDEGVPGAWFSRLRPPTFTKGGVDAETIDHAYSEFVLLPF